MSRKFNSGGGLLAMEETVIVEGEGIGFDATDEQLFGKTEEQELPDEAKDILVYFTEEKAQEISETGPTLALESFWNLISDIESIRTSVRNECGVSQSLAMECERLMPGFLTEDYPIKTFSQIPTRTNLNYTVEAFDVRSGAIIAAIIAVIIGIAKLMFGGDSSSSGSGGAASKVDDKMDKLTDTAKKAEENLSSAIAKGGLVADDAKKMTSPSFKVDGLPKDHPLTSRLATLNEHAATGLNGVQSFVLGIEHNSSSDARKFWDVAGKGHYTDSVITLNLCFERINKVIKANVAPNGEVTTEQGFEIKSAVIESYSEFKHLKMFENISFEPVKILGNDQAAQDFFNSDPSQTWVNEFMKLKDTPIKTGYISLLTATIATDLWHADSFFYKEFGEIVKDKSRRTKIFQDLGKNATMLETELPLAFKNAHAKENAENSAAVNVSSETTTIIKHALKLCQFILKVLRNMAHIYDMLIEGVGTARRNILADIETLADIKIYQARATTGAAT